jgi:hypothetical protein
MEGAFYNMDKKYVFNLETTKIELHFEKSEYDALSEQQKSKLKSAFLWSNYGKCWVSRAKEPNLYGAKQVAKALGFTEEEREGERLSFAEQIERKEERAEERAERYEEYAANAQRRGATLQKPISDMRGDISFFTQPILAGHSGSQSFARRREKMFDQYHKGMEEYRKSDYFRGRADIARENANGEKYKDKAYLDRHIKEVRTEIKKREQNIVHYEQLLYELEEGTQKTKYNGEAYTIEETSGWLDHELELIQVAQDKEAYFLNCLDALGGITFSPDNIKVGYIVHVRHSGRCEVVSVGRVNIMYKILEGGAKGMVLKAAYAEIKEVIEAVEEQKEVHPWKVGDEFTCPIWEGHKQITKTFRVIKASNSTITLQTGEEKPFIRKPAKARYAQGDMWCVSIADNYGSTFYKKPNGEQVSDRALYA